MTGLAAAQQIGRCVSDDYRAVGEILHAGCRVCVEKICRRVLIQWLLRIKSGNAAVRQNKRNAVRLSLLVQRHLADVVKDGFSVFLIQCEVLHEGALSAVRCPLGKLRAGIVGQIIHEIVRGCLRRERLDAADEGQFVIAQRWKYIRALHHVVQQTNRIRTEINAVSQNKHGVLIGKMNGVQ